MEGAEQQQPGQLAARMPPTPQDQVQEGEPLLEEEEARTFFTTLSSFYLYRRASHATLTHQRRKSFHSLPREHQELLNSPPISYLNTLAAVDSCIERNATLAEAILHSAAGMLNIDLGSPHTLPPGWEHLASADDLDKTRATLKQFYRDWSIEGTGEREKCYGPIISAIEDRFGNGKSKPKHDIKVLIPGAGLGRLPYEFVSRGYNTEGNEFSYHMLAASNFVLNSTNCAGEFIVHPFVSGFSNHRTRGAHLRGVKIPDVHPATELMRPREVEYTDEQGNIAKKTIRPSDIFGMSAGEFVGAYSQDECKGKFDAVATCFFLDTAPNVIRYIETIREVLKPGAVWVNLGPLLWHWEGGSKGGAASSEGDDHADGGHGGHDHIHASPPVGFSHGRSHSHGHTHTQSGGNGDKDSPGDYGKVSLELTLNEVISLIEKLGFKIEERRTVETGYIQDEQSMMNYEYKAEFWVATKV